ncbi:MAG: CoB--CoM heterodisulfide reductase iron-sulfur subunit A family protein [Thermoplasmata archaeon]|nr:MAG: CoB--CoM heterodisulfide reductase iron-sulfur subunit A family protein [Thermoplasmata archaeon]
MKKPKKEKIRIGVFVCHCGANIANTVDVKDVVKFARKLPDVTFAMDHQFMCSEDGQNSISDAISKKKLDRVVVASCSPRLHEHTFRVTVADAGLNPYQFEMANIRENVSWVHHSEPKKATEKAKHIVKGAVARAKKLEAIDQMTVPVTQSVLVIGGGIAGIQAALDVADMGFQVTLVDKKPSIGGNMARLVETFPTGDCAMCILSPKMAEVARNPAIEILTYSEVVDVKGYIGNFVVTIRKKARYVDKKKCVGCGDCSEKCPVEVENEWDMGMGKRKAIYLQFPQALPRTYVIDKKNCIKITKNKCGVCKKVCPADAIDFKHKDKDIELKVGAIIVATGAQEFDPTGILEYGYGEHEDVITQLQLARMMDPSGPTEGKVIKPSDEKIPKKYLMIQCAGSRDEKYNPYCSRVCCMSAIKHAMMILSEQDPDAEIYLAYTDIRSFGKGYEEYYKRATEEGVRFVRSKIAEVMKGSKGKLVARLEDTDVGEVLTIEPDLVVLSTGLVPDESAENLARMLRLEKDSYNFLTERHPKLAPVDTKIDGIYLCGCAQGPKDIPDSVAQARAAAVAALKAISKKEITMNLAIAHVDEGLCNQCGICIEACPYEAIEIEEKEEGGIGQPASVIEAVCKSCGICAAECPTGAIELKHYTTNQMIDQIDGICRDLNEKI